MMLVALSAYQMPATSFYVEPVTMLEGLPCWLSRKESACNAGDVGFDPRVRKIPGGEMATHSSILAWEILWIEEPGGLQWGRERVGHD